MRFRWLLVAVTSLSKKLWVVAVLWFWGENTLAGYTMSLPDNGCLQWSLDVPIIAFFCRSTDVLFFKLFSTSPKLEAVPPGAAPRNGTFFCDTYVFT